MAHLIDFHGRLPPEEARGPSDLVFALHPSTTSAETLWSETVGAVPIAPTGAFEVVLGRHAAISPDIFEESPRWMSVRTLRGGRTGEETGPRVPVSGAGVRLAANVADLEARVARFESALGQPERVKRRIRLLHRRLRELEEGRGPLVPVHSNLGELRERVASLDGEDGRLDRIEDELGDIVGPDGDIIDLLERIEKLEGSGPVPKPAPPPPPPNTLARMDPRFIAQLAERAELLTQRLKALEDKVEHAPVVTAESLHAVKRGGDTMTGGLTINRGGLEVLSGGITCRGADVNTLEAAIHVKAPRIIADGIELRGDLTVDSTRRTLQVRHLEGRAGSGRKDGALMLNTRSGEEVVVGNAEVHAGMEVFGSARATEGFAARSTGLASWLDATEGLEVGEVCAVNARGVVVRSTAAGQTNVVGVCVGAGALVTGQPGEGRVRVAWGGAVKVRVTGDVHPGDRLVSSAVPGRACPAESPAPGACLGRALGNAKGEAGEVLVLLGGG